MCVQKAKHTPNSGRGWQNVVIVKLGNPRWTNKGTGLFAGEMFLDSDKTNSTGRPFKKMTNYKIKV